MKHFKLLVLLALGLALACSDGGRGEPEPAEGDCDPFSHELGEPTELGVVLAAGRDSAGAVYVVDEIRGGAERRAFSGSETILTQNVAREGFGMNDGTLETFGLTVDVLPRPYLLIVEIEGDELRIARTFNTDVRATGIADLSPSELLEVIEPEALEDAEVRGVPGRGQTQYFARAPNGELLVVTGRPDSSDYYESFRVFYGKPDALLERELISVTHAGDGGSTHILFELDGEQADAFFPVDLNGAEPLPVLSVEQDDDVVPLERLYGAATELLETAHFQCLR